jgi:hypothetical protein
MRAIVPAADVEQLSGSAMGAFPRKVVEQREEKMLEKAFSEIPAHGLLTACRTDQLPFTV